MQAPPPVVVDLPPVQIKRYRPRLDSKDIELMDNEVKNMVRNNTNKLCNPEHWQQQRGYMTTPSPVPWGGTDLNFYPEEEITHFEEDVTPGSYFSEASKEVREYMLN